jgi:class 3 adenylate cyclase
MYGAQLAYLRYFQGRLQELAALLDAGAEQHPQPAWRAAAAWAHATLGNEEAARRYLAPLVADDFAAMPQDGNWPAGMTLLAQALYEIGEVEPAPRLYELLLPFAESNVFAGGAASPRGPGHYYLGLLAHTLGRLDTAVDHMERAVELTRRWGIRPLDARSRLEFATLLQERQAPGDPERALQLLNEAMDTARQIGSAHLVEDALARKLEAQGIDASQTRRSIYSVAHAVQARRPDLAGHTAADGSVTLIFSDMEGFTSMTERLGDEAAHKVIQRHNRIVREQVKAQRGHEVDSQGDGFLVAFATPRQGALAAVGLQQAFTAYCAEHPEEPIRVRIGLHTGQAIRDAEKFFGRTVIMACRIADQARATEILVSPEARDALAEDFRFGEPRGLTLKGFSGTHAAFPLAWDA